ncbi:rRNA methyltransferase [Actinorhabdospora filicis]|uniref:rRNA methyltransferase n=1 Tax=Actinorhabdospora filicis TaxID=1785913 RepID=A0A9W6SE39_9ACTN|nr:TrmH family RNA methyltransferase [Actinorhabdospora filicis]GLZ75539.1 rRNA methyltransferase [Actinorhabdospora filicis]
MSGRSYVGRRNATFQQWESLLVNRKKRQRAGAFLVQGVRPVTMAARAGWPVSAVLCRAETRLSEWARGVLDQVGAPVAEVSAELIAELGERPEEPPEVLLVADMPADDLSRIEVGPGFLGAVFDRPTSPGNIGTLIRSADAFGASGVIVTGHAADVYDPRAVRASTGSLFAVPTVRAASHAPVVDWARTHPGLVIAATDEAGTVELADLDLTRPTLLLIGNETAGLSQGWREAADVLVRIPMGGTASSLNAATAATIAFYEARVQRDRGRRG